MIKKKDRMIYYGDIYTKLHECKTQLTIKKYRQYIKLSQWVENGKSLFNQNTLA